MLYIFIATTCVFFVLSLTALVLFVRARKRFGISEEENEELSEQLALKSEELEKSKKAFVSAKEKIFQLVNQFKSERSKWNALHERQKRENSDLSEQNARLEKWKVIADAEDKAEQILRECREKEAASKTKIFEAEKATKVRINNALRATQEKQKVIIANAEREAIGITTAAENKGNIILFNNRQKIIEQEERIAELTTQADDIIGSATKMAEDIYGGAHVKLIEIQNEHYRTESTIKAIENKIKGYGPEYLVPGLGLLDDLADDYSHTEAGKKLKEARQKTKAMFKENLSAECDYVETYRKETAIAFVSDAFNGKVEDILSRVKHDNYGVLKQEITDAAILVNLNGKAFRNARITPEYVEARLEELKQATIVHEIRKREKEEQREIRERIREEKKLQKEIEKARKEAEKALKEQERQQRERDALQKALEEARARGELEEKIREMERLISEKDTEIAAKQQQIDDSQRAISMAQQTKAGHVYVISNVGSFGDDVFKIGMTRRLDPEDRINELGGASVPFPFDIHAMIHAENAPDFEHKLHRVFVLNQLNKTNTRKEFFRIKLADIKEAVEKMGVDAHWTMLSEAAQYRETLRIEDRIKTDEEYRKEWENRQYRIEMLDESNLSEDEEEE